MLIDMAGLALQTENFEDLDASHREPHRIDDEDRERIGSSPAERSLAEESFEIEAMRLFHNRIRILLLLPDSAYPATLREDNPLSASMWAEGGFGRIRAFVSGADAVAEAIWQALRRYEEEKT